VLRGWGARFVCAMVALGSGVGPGMEGLTGELCIFTLWVSWVLIHFTTKFLKLDKLCSTHCTCYTLARLQEVEGANDPATGLIYPQMVLAGHSE
jgi:hypothetical protein